MAFAGTDFAGECRGSEIQDLSFKLNFPTKKNTGTYSVWELD